MRLIDADALMKDISVIENGLIDVLSTRSADEWDECRDRFIILMELEIIKVLKEVIEEAPTVERAKGEWINEGNLHGCSNCGKYSKEYDKPFCCHCGADMRGDNNGN